MTVSAWAWRTGRSRKSASSWVALARWPRHSWHVMIFRSGSWKRFSQASGTDHMSGARILNTRWACFEILYMLYPLERWRTTDKTRRRFRLEVPHYQPIRKEMQNPSDAERATLAVSGMRLNKSLALIALASLTICSAKAQLEAGERIVTEAEALNALGLPAPNLYVSPESNFVARNQSGHGKRLQP
jgi:hypothetical protein